MTQVDANRTPSNLTEQFMQALQVIEQTGDVEPLVALFAKGSSLKNLTTHTWTGQDGAREFWTAYLSNFEQIRSEFTHHLEASNTGLMEWEATGQLKGGSDLAYRGVSIIEIDGDKVSAFRTYYDSAAFVNTGVAEVRSE
ncbi:nuclear transport factor 2 family protein [Deinococcus sp. QL22]|uniref:nuclear transport factor 2 family protein n=1 Tax=Deinococcus sp. QL22 TaxID=2939437 RepID=UPI0020174AA8|nr:nuclear transport factor 2 family protein [Deinococcus sp. QL22]UQN05248.1 nuclear transport factor 2 family protein [Deinococcus sp. QL22]